MGSPYSSLYIIMSWDSSVSIVIRLRVRQPRNRGLIPPGANSSLPRRVHISPGANTACYEMSTGVKRLERVTDHSSQSSTVVHKEWNYTSTTPYVSFIQYLIKHREITFTSSHIREIKLMRWAGHATRITKICYALEDRSLVPSSPAPART
jgi:hypothetical protein